MKAGVLGAALLLGLSGAVPLAGAALAPLASSELLLPPSIDGRSWDEVIDREGAQGVTFGVRIAGPSPYLRNAGSRFVPASVTKVFTAAAALEYLGPEFRFTTEMRFVELSGEEKGAISSLVLVGHGDPTWGMLEFGEDPRTRVRKLASALKARGITTVFGAVRAEAADPRWEDLRYPPGWSPEDRTACYGAQGQAFNLDINCAFYVVEGPARGYWSDSSVSIPVTLDIRPGTRTALVVEDARPTEAASTAFRIRGTWAAGTAPQRQVLPVHHTQERVQRLFVEALIEQGIVLHPEAVPAGRDGSVVVLEFQSAPLAEILRPFLKLSLNMIGDVLFKTLGQRFGGDPSLSLLEAGRRVMAEFTARLGAATARELGVPVQHGFFTEEVILRDGSGVSRSNSLTTGAVMALLQDALRWRGFPAIWEALPIAGVDGTLSKRMVGTPAQGVLRAKTGTLSGVYNLAGYVPRFSSSGKVSGYVPFVMLTSTSPENGAAARAAQDRVGAELARIVNSD